MVLADFVFVWVGGALLLGFFGFFAVLVAAVVRIVRAIIRALLPVWHRTEDVGTSDARACVNPRCGHVNPPGARFCGRCGNSLP